MVVGFRFDDISTGATAGAVALEQIKLDAEATLARLGPLQHIDGREQASALVADALQDERHENELDAEVLAYNAGMCTPPNILTTSPHKNALSDAHIQPF